MPHAPDPAILIGTMPNKPPIDRAQRLRRQSSAPERAAWETLRSLRKLGYPVRRQHPLAGYTVDFAIVRAKLVIEIDGRAHIQQAVMADDARRDAVLEARGWRVLRVDADVAQSRDHLLQCVSQALGLD